MIKIVFDKEKNMSLAYDDNVKIGECNFIENDGYWNIIHTEVSNLYQGQGIAKKLVEIIVAEAEKYNKDVMADCSYAKRVIEKG